MPGTLLSPPNPGVPKTPQCRRAFPRSFGEHQAQPPGGTSVWKRARRRPAEDSASDSDRAGGHPPPYPQAGPAPASALPLAVTLCTGLAPSPAQMSPEDPVQPWWPPLCPASLPLPWPPLDPAPSGGLTPGFWGGHAGAGWRPAAPGLSLVDWKPGGLRCRAARTSCFHRGHQAAHPWSEGLSQAQGCADPRPHESPLRCLLVIPRPCPQT